MAEPRRLIAIDRLDLDLGGHPILEAIDLVVDRGEIVSLIGPNGAGKTSLVRVALGLLPPTRGRVWRAPGAVIGYVPQRLTLDPVLPLSVRRFLALGIRVPGSKRDAGLAEVGLSPLLLDRPVQQVSGGEFQRLLLARALLRQPDLLVLDEPAQGVDLAGQSEIYQLITRIRDHHGLGVLLVSHDLHLVMAATNRVLCINRHLCCVGQPEAVSQHPEYIALFGRRVAENLALYTHHHDHLHDSHGAVLPLPADNDEHRHA